MNDAPAGQTPLQRYETDLARLGFVRDPAQREAVRALDGVYARLVHEAPPAWWRRWIGRSTASVPGLYLWGGVGRGKTWLMDLFFESLPFAERRRQHFHRFMHDVHAQLAALKHERDPLEQVAETMARGTRVLCFDELQVSDIADAMILGNLFDALFRRAVTLVATSNNAPRELYRDGLQRARFVPAIALLERHLEVWRVAGATDYRLRALTRAGVYLPSGAADTPSRLEQLFARLSCDGAGVGGTIVIEGRPIAVIREAPGVLWCDFTALCSGPRSQDDYIEIAREYHSVIVSAVPVLETSADDEARRFIALIDEFYERNVKVIVSAAAAATGLYRGERLAAPFERTVSRLIEMQSAEYLAREHKP